MCSQPSSSKTPRTAEPAAAEAPQPGFVQRWMQRAQKAPGQTQRFLKEGIWEIKPERKTSSEALLRFSRVILLTVRGVMGNQLTARAGALSYSSLIGLGPILAMVILVTGIFNRDNVEGQIRELIQYVAPTMQEYAEETPEGEPAGQSESSLDQLINQLVEGAQSLLDEVNTGGATVAGIIGFVVLLVVAVQLIVAIETTFNHIWGVDGGRNWGQRIVLYWSFISLGAVLGISGAGLLSASSLAQMANVLPFEVADSSLLPLISKALSFVILTTLFTLIYMILPVTRVHWRPALMGGLVATALLVLYNLLSFFYVNKVIQLQSLYGSLGILVVLMFGLYFFWLFVLLGGQLAYAAQNADYLSREHVWSNISPRAREVLHFTVFVRVAERFHRQENPYTAEGLSEALYVPPHVLFQSIKKLRDIEWLTLTEVRDEKGTRQDAYVPGKPLDQVRVSDLLRALNTHGDEASVQELRNLGPLVDGFTDYQHETLEGAFGQKTFTELLSEHKGHTADSGAVPGASTALRESQPAGSSA